MPANSRWDLIRGLKGYLFRGGSPKSRIVIGFFEKVSSDICVDGKNECHKNATCRAFVLA